MKKTCCKYRRLFNKESLMNYIKKKLKLTIAKFIQQKSVLLLILTNFHKEDYASRAQELP